MIYPAVFIPPASEKEGWGVVFPDLPECVSAGDTFEEAFENAPDAVECALCDEEEIPKPSTLEEAKRRYAEEWLLGGTPDPRTVFQYVSADVAPARKSEPPVRINISLKPAVLKEIDSTADGMGLTRSGLIAAACREYCRAWRRDAV